MITRVSKPAYGQDLVCSIPKMSSFTKEAQF